MYDKDLKLYPHPILREVMPKVDLATEEAEIRVLAQKLLYKNRKLDGFGLAANQIGVKKRVFCYLDGRKPKIIINPSWKTCGFPSRLVSEGCLSIPGYRFRVLRDPHIFIEGIDLDGNQVAHELVDFDQPEAQCFQHEINHMDGILLLDLITDKERADFEQEWQKAAEKRRANRTNSKTNK